MTSGSPSTPSRNCSSSTNSAICRSRRAAHLFFQLVSRRYERGSMMITSNRSVAEWGEVFGDAVVATAILDRLLHHSHVLTITGESYPAAREAPRRGAEGPGAAGAGGRAIGEGGRSGPRTTRRDQRRRVGSSRQGAVFVSPGGQFLMSLDKAVWTASCGLHGELLRFGVKLN